MVKKKQGPKVTYTVEWKKSSQDVWRFQASGLTLKQARDEAGVGLKRGQGIGESGWSPWATVRILRITEPKQVYLRKGRELTLK